MSIVSANITDVYGTLSTKNISKVNNNQIDIRTLSPGYYNLSVTDKRGKIHSVKFRKK